MQDPIVKQYIDPKLTAMVENLQMHAYAAGTVELWWGAYFNNYSLYTSSIFTFKLNTYVY